MFKTRCYWMFILMICINAYQQFIPGAVMVLVPMAIIVLKRTEYSKLETTAWLLLTLAAMGMTVYSLFR